MRGGLDVLAVLLDEAVRLVVELSQRLARPPILSVAVLVEARSDRVEAMGQLVSDDGTDGAVVEGDRALLVEEGRLEHGGGNGYKDKTISFSVTQTQHIDEDTY